MSKKTRNIIIAVAVLLVLVAGALLIYKLNKPAAQLGDKNITVTVDGGQIKVTRPNDEKQNRAMHGLYRALIANMVTGVTTGYTKNLELVGVGYRAQAESPTKLVINIGFSHPVNVDAPEHITFETPAPTQIVVKGIDKQQVGNIAADIRAIRPPEPYLGKGIKYEDEVIRRKEGKTGKK